MLNELNEDKRLKEFGLLLPGDPVPLGVTSPLLDVGIKSWLSCDSSWLSCDSTCYDPPVFQECSRRLEQR